MIIYAVSANTSVEQLFVAGVVPGLLGAFGLMAVAYGFARRYNLPPILKILCGIHDSSANFYRYQAAGLSDMTVVAADGEPDDMSVEQVISLCESL